MNDAPPYPVFLIGVIVVLSLLTRFAGLASVNQVIFDEVHFGKFITAYCCTGEHFFDIHPPHAKLIIAGASKLAGFAGGFSFTQIGQPYGEVNAAYLRLPSAIAGALLPLVIFWLLRVMGASASVAFFGAWVAIFDNALIIQSRVIALDSMLLVAIFGALGSFLAAEKSRSAAAWLWTAVSGLLSGLAVGTKFTGLVAIALLLLFHAWFFLREVIGNPGSWYRHVAARGTRVLLVVCVAIFVYVGGWALHYYLLPLPGPGDAWQVVSFERPLALSFLRHMYDLHFTMFEANYNLSSGHPDESPWWSWPLMLRPVYYWQGQGTALYFWGNPVVWWGSVAILLGALCACVIDAWRHRTHLTPVIAWFAVVGYAAAYVPLMRIPRSLFLYHYLTPLLFAVLFAAVWGEGRGWFTGRRIYWWMGVVLVGWLLFFPVTYGWPEAAWLNALSARLPRWSS